MEVVVLEVEGCTRAGCSREGEEGSCAGGDLEGEGGLDIGGEGYEQSRYRVGDW